MVKNNNYITSNLKFIRKELNLSQNRYSKLFNVDQTTIARWEDENRKPTIDKAIEISNILGISLDVLTGIDLKNNRDYFNKEKLLELINQIKIKNDKKEKKV